MHHAKWLRRTSWTTVMGIALSAGGPLLAGDAAPPDEQAPTAQEAAPAEVSTPPDKSQPKEAQRDKNAAKPQGRVLIPKYRLGAALAPVPAALNDQLGLKGEGLLIQRVAPGGPAEKAGIQRDDILLAVDDKPITKYVDLVEASNASGGKMTVKLLRGAKTIIVTVTLDKHRMNDEKIFIPRTGAADPEESEEPVQEKAKAGQELPDDRDRLCRVSRGHRP